MSVPEALTNLCRLCMSSKGEMKDIFKATMKISLLVCIEVQASDQLPKQICEECEYSLEKFYIFRKLCKKSEVKYKSFLRKMRTKKIKSLHELSEDEDEDDESDDTNLAYVENYEKRIINEEVQKQQQESQSQFERTKAMQMEEDLKYKVAVEKKKILGEIRLELLETLSAMETTVNVEDEESKIEEVTHDEPQQIIIQYAQVDNTVPYQNNTLNEEIAPSKTKRPRRFQKDTTGSVEDFQLMDLTETEGEATDTTIVLKNVLIHDCPKCDRKFHTAEEMEKHAQNHKTSKNVCDICSKVFSSTGVLARHQKIHSMEKNYKCDDCDKRFTQKGSLLRHSLIHSDMKPFTCEKCEKAFTQRHLLTKHWEVEHSETPVTYRYPCKYCSKTFNFSSGLSRHIVAHTGKKFACSYCKREFSDASSLSRHVRVKHFEGRR